MRAMLGGKTAEVPAEKSESDPASGTEKKSTEQERGTDGKFQPKGEKQPVATEEQEPSDNVGKRISKAVKAQRDAERKAAELEREIAELKAGRSAPAKTEKKEAPSTATAKADKKPEAGDFTSYDDYISALTRWEIKQAREADAKAEGERKQADELKARNKAWSDKKDKARAKHPDIDDVIESLGDTPISRAMHNAITESEIGPELAYFLATHPDDAERISKLNPFLAAKEMGRIEDKLTAAPPVEDKKPAAKKDLPKPARTVTGAGTSAKEQRLDDPDLPLEEFKRIAGSTFRRSR